MANLNVPGWAPPTPFVIEFPVVGTTAALPGNATFYVGAAVVPTVPRPDGSPVTLTTDSVALAAQRLVATGGSANVRYIVDSAKVVFGATNTVIETGTSLVVNVLNAGNASAAVATLTTAAAAANTLLASTAVSLTLSTSTDTRGGLALVPRTVLFAGDVITANLVGTNANTVVAIGSRVQINGHWEQQVQFPG